MAWCYRLWNSIHEGLIRLRFVHCWWCDNKGSGMCNCGADGIDWEVSGGAHYRWCFQYNGCDHCGRA